MYPLLLGGPGECDAYGFSDGSLHTGSKMRSVGSYFVFASPLGGAIQSCTFESKYQVLNVMHIELDGITQLANALLYISHACQELNVPTPITRRIYTDSEAAQSHCLNNSASKKSKHLELRLQTVQDYQEDDRIDVIYVPGGENCADQGTKSLDPETNLKHTMVILGHRMMQGKGIEGVLDWVPAKIARVQAAYFAADTFGYEDVTISERSCDEMCSHFAFCAFSDSRHPSPVVQQLDGDPALVEVESISNDVSSMCDEHDSISTEHNSMSGDTPLHGTDFVAKDYWADISSAMIHKYPMTVSSQSDIMDSEWVVRKDFKCQNAYDITRLREMNTLVATGLWSSKGRDWLEHKILDCAMHTELIRSWGTMIHQVDVTSRHIFWAVHAGSTISFDLQHVVNTHRNCV